MFYFILIIKEILVLFFFILIFRFFFLKQIKKCNNNFPIPNLINFFIFKFSNCLITPFVFFVDKIYENKEWINVILAFLFSILYTMCFYGDNINLNLFNVIIISFLYLFEYYLIIILIFLLMEILLTIFKPTSNLNYFFYSLNLRIFKRLKKIKINKYILGINVDLLIYFLSILIFIIFFRMFMKAYTMVYK